MLLGLDFDNTIIQYDELFHKIACEKNLIPDDLAKEKNAVRDYLRKKNIEYEWTMIQGEVYGERIMEAVPYEGMLKTLRAFADKKIPIMIISHKTREPYLGPKNDLHAAAISWLEINHFFEPGGLNMKKNQIFFEMTKKEKIDRIIKTGCTHYVDDLPEILAMIPNGINKILVSPNREEIPVKNWTVVKSWKELKTILS